VIFVVPAATPVATPVLLPIVAIATSPLLHVPPAGVVNSVVLLPIQALAVPLIAVGNAFTVTVVARRHVVGNV
jgi:hypothetical protein